MWTQGKVVVASRYGDWSAAVEFGGAALVAIFSKVERLDCAVDSWYVWVTNANPMATL